MIPTINFEDDLDIDNVLTFVADENGVHVTIGGGAAGDRSFSLQWQEARLLEEWIGRVLKLKDEGSPMLVPPKGADAYALREVSRKWGPDLSGKIVRVTPQEPT